MLRKTHMPPRLIDVRQPFEFASRHIAGSELVPLATLAKRCETWDRNTHITLICKSGHRASIAREQLISRGFHNLDVLVGGVDAWAASGKPLVVAEKKPWSLERQLRATAGVLVLVSLALAFTVSQGFLTVTALMGAGLFLSGLCNIGPSTSAGGCCGPKA